MTGSLFIGGSWRQSPPAPIRSPFDGQVVAEVAQARPPDVEDALALAWSSRAALQRQSTGQRQRVLEGIAQGIAERREDLANSIVLEAGKPLAYAEGEVARAIQTFRLASAALSAFGGEVVPIDLEPRTEGYRCEVQRFPTGVVVGISPFNFPLNLAAHKVAPALAVGAPMILKPPPQAPSAALLLAEIAQAAGAPPGALSVLPCGPELSEAMAVDARVSVLSFTGSARVGWHLRSRARRKVVLELGGNAAVLVCRDADLDRAAEKIAVAAYAYAGQVCISVQRILVEAPVRGPFLERLLARIEALPVGDPRRRDTVVGPVIDASAAERVERWVEAALRAGGKALIRGKREAALLSPSLLEDVPSGQEVVTEEVFGPVAVVQSFEGLEEGLALANAGRYGLQAGLFTHDARVIRRAFEGLEVGGLVVNDSPMFRSDAMPYGGVKESGLGREGLRYAMEELTEPRALVTAPD